MITFEEMQALHPTAKIEQINPHGLYIISYPGLKLAISINLLLGYCYNNRWTSYISHSKSVTTKINKDVFTYKYDIWYWLETQKELRESLQKLLDSSIRSLSYSPTQE